MYVKGELARHLLDAAPDPIIVANQRGEIVFANSQVKEVFGYEPAELLDRPLEVLLPERFREAHRRHRDGFFAAPRPRAMGAGIALFGLHRDGREFPVEVSLSPLFAESGLLVSSAIRDVTAQRETERRLAAADRAKSRFLAAASHDLRQPLQALNLLNKAIARQVDDNELAASIVAKQQEALGSMSALLNSLLDISKLDAGVVVPNPVDCDADEILDRLRVNHEQQALEKGLRFTVSGCRAAVYTDPALLQQILANLVGNAVRYTLEGEVAVSCRDSGDRHVRFEVRDTGLGIANDELERIFEEFYQIDHGSQRPEGLGLGLSIVKRLAALLGFELEVTSSPGRGTAFSFAVERGRNRGVAPVAPAPAARAAGGTILIVDDERPVAEATKMLLEIEGFGVRLATCEREALAEARAHRPDLVISDYHLRGGETGLGVALSVRRELQTEIPVVFVTGDTSKLSAEAANLGSADFLTKPLEPDDLLAIVRRRLAAARPPLAVG